MSTPWSWSGGGGRQADEVRWSRKVTEMGQGADKDEKGKKGGHTMTAPSWLDLGELSHMHIHLTTDHDSTQLNALPCMGNAEYSPTRTSLTSMDISGQAGMAR